MSALRRAALAASILIILPALCLSAMPGTAADIPAASSQHPKMPASTNTGAAVISAGSILRVKIAGPVKFSKLAPGQALDGITTEPLYEVDRMMVPAATHVRMVLDRVERVKTQRPRFPRVLELFFRPPYQWKRHYRVFFRSADLEFPGRQAVPASFSFIRAVQPERVQPRVKGSSQSLTPATRVQAEAADRGAHSQGQSPQETVFLLRFSHPVEIPAAFVAQSGPEREAGSGTRGRFILMSPIRASTSRRGQTFLASLAEPMELANGHLVPAGTILQGWVSARRPPRRFWRSGSLHLSMSGMSVPCGRSAAATGSVSGIEADRNSRLKLGPEGTIQARPPSKATLFFTLGVTGGISKAADDGFQLLLESLISGATDASTAGVARYVAAAASAVFLTTRHGQDVVLPKYTEFDVTFTRPVVFKGNSQGVHAPACR